MDDNKYKMVGYLDEPERILFFTVDEFIALMLPIAVGIKSHHGLIGIVIGIVLTTFLKKAKSKDNDGFLQRMIYWYFPSGLLRLKRVPASYLRKYMG